MFGLFQSTPSYVGDGQPSAGSTGGIGLGWLTGILGFPGTPNYQGPSPQATEPTPTSTSTSTSTSTKTETPTGTPTKAETPTETPTKTETPTETDTACGDKGTDTVVAKTCGIPIAILIQRAE